MIKGVIDLILKMIKKSFLTFNEKETTKKRLKGTEDWAIRVWSEIRNLLLLLLKYIY